MVNQITPDQVEYEAIVRISNGMSDIKTARLISGCLALITIFISNGSLTPTQLQTLQAAVKKLNWMEDVYKAYNTLIAMSPIPLDYKNDSYWPVPPT